MLSRYETNQRAPKITIAREYAAKLGVSLDYMLGDSVEEGIFAELCQQSQDKPFYKIFIEVTQDKMGLFIDDLVRITGLTDRQVRTIITRRVKDAPLPLALQLSDTLGVPLEVWTGNMMYTPVEISVEAREVALAYDRSDEKDRSTVRHVLDLIPVSNKENRQ